MGLVADRVVLGGRRNDTIISIRPTSLMVTQVLDISDKVADILIDLRYRLVLLLNTRVGVSSDYHVSLAEVVLRVDAVQLVAEGYHLLLLGRTACVLGLGTLGISSLGLMLAVDIN